MLKFTIRIIVLSCFVLLLAACSSGYKAFQRGDYYDACMKAAERLRADPDNKKAQKALANAYPHLLNNSLREAENGMAYKTVASMDRVIGIYDRLNMVADAIHSSPGALRVIPDPQEFHNERRTVMNIVGEMAYDEGVKALAQGTMQSARTAYNHFVLANKYIPGYKDVTRLTERARYEATLRVIVERPIVPGNYALDAEFFYTAFMSEITRRTYRDFVRFYTMEEARAEEMNTPHQVLILDFERFTIGNTRESSNTTEYKKENVVIGTTKVNGQNQNVYGTVKAKLTVNRIEIISTGQLAIRMMDPTTRRILNQRNFPGRSVWATEWASFNGNERALSKEQLALVGRKPGPPPPPQELFASFVSPMYQQAASFIGSIY